MILKIFIPNIKLMSGYNIYLFNDFKYIILILFNKKEYNILF